MPVADNKPNDKPQQKQAHRDRVRAIAQTSEE